MTESIRDEPKVHDDELADTLSAISVLARMVASLLRSDVNEDERNYQDGKDE